MTCLALQETFRHLKHHDYHPDAYYGFVHRLADTWASTRPSLEEMFSLLAHRHKTDSYKKGPWQNPHRVFFYNTDLGKRMNTNEYPVMTLKPCDFVEPFVRAKTGLHWLAAARHPEDVVLHDVILKTISNQLTRTDNPLVPGQLHDNSSAR